MHRVVLALTTIAFLSLAQAQQPERVAFREPCDGKPVLDFWEGKKPIEIKAETATADPAPAEGKACTRLTLKWGEGNEGFSYWPVNTFRDVELLNGVNYRFRGKVWCPKGAVCAKVRWLCGGKEVIWHAPEVKLGNGWCEFVLEDLRKMAVAIAPKDYDCDRVVLATIFFNLSDQVETFAVDDLKVTAEGTPLPQYVRPQECKFALPWSGPLLRIEVEGPCADLVLKQEGKDEPVFTAAPYAEAKEPGKHVFYAGGDGFPPLTRTGTGKVLRLTGHNGRPEPLYTYESADGNKWNHGITEVLSMDQPRGPINTGVYYSPYAINDPHMVPSSAWVWFPKPEQVAPYDFSVIQTSSAMPTREFCDKIMQLNPKHKLILRLPCVRGAIPMYWHEQFYRDGFMDLYNSVIERAGRKNVYAVSIGEEETGNFMSGLWWTDTPPDWVALYKQPFERETGKQLSWINAVCGNDEYLEWMKPKIRFFFNDVYDRLKQKWPDLPVLQYLALKDDGSGIAWHEPGEIKADGWVYWGFHLKKAPVLVTCKVPGEEKPVPVWMYRDGMFQGLQRIRYSGVDNELIFHCGFAHEAEGKYYDPIEQMKMLQDLGYRNSFMFYPLGAFLEKSDCRDPAKAGEMDRGDYRMWRERRLKVLEYMRGMK